MSPETIALVQASWQKVAAISDQAGPLFYQNLFNHDPSVKTLFKGDIIAQSHRLMEMIGIAVSNLDSIETLIPVLQNLARRHVSYGVQESHYQSVGYALIQTLAQGLGDDFTYELREAWLEVYTLIAHVMITATKEH